MLPESHYRASRQYHFIVEVCDSSEPVVEGVDVNTVQVEEVEADEAIVSMCATSSNPNLSTMKLKGEVVANKAIFALLDSGSTHSFINPVVIDGMKCKLEFPWGW